jgi:SAM-dependent methyltransferase
MRWQVKCAIDNAKALLPFQAQLRRLKDRLVPYQSNFEDDVRTVAQGVRQVQWVGAVRPLNGATVLEVGSGWQPMIPILYSLAGASRVLLTDLNVLLRPDTFAAALRTLRTQRQLIQDGLKVDAGVLDQMLREDAAATMDQRLKELRLVYMAPCDCRNLNLPAASVDVVTSRACLEHIAPDVLQDIFHESHRLLKPGGLACHWVDPSDHWEHQDKSLSRVNFLKYSDFWFRWTYINPINYQNRLRHPEYAQMLATAGFRIVREEREVDEASLHQLAHLQVAARFRAFSKQDLATVDSLFLATRNQDPVSA